MAIVVLQHGEDLGPGRLGMTLRDHGYRLDIRRVDLSPTHGQPVPPDLDDVQGVVCLGGEQNVGEDHPWMEAEMALIRAAHGAELPVIGICLGAQLVATALGGTVEPMPEPEVGFVDVQINPVGQVAPLLAGIPWKAPWFSTHEQQITEPAPGSTVLASSERCAVQVFSAGLRTLGVQFHPEWDREGIERVIERESGRWREQGVDPDGIAGQLDGRYPMFARVADRLCLNITTFLLTADRHLAV